MRYYFLDNFLAIYLHTEDKFVNVIPLLLSSTKLHSQLPFANIAEALHFMHNKLQVSASFASNKMP